MDLAALRQEYMRAGLHEKDLAPDPFAQYGNRFDEALQSGIALPNAKTLATATQKGRPSARAVLLKGFDAQGFVFYTHYGSRKGRELGQNPQAMLLFCWEELERQVGIEGRVEQVPAAESTGISRAGRWARGSRRSSRRRASRWRAARTSKHAWRRQPSAGATLRRARRTGAATGLRRTGSNSGRAAGTGCTTGCAIASPAAPGK